MPIELTQLSAAEYKTILYGQMTPAMAASYLQNEQIILRSFDETLREMYPAEDLLPRLTDFFLSHDPAANPSSIARKIRNWLSGKNQPANREDIFQIAFALGLGEDQLDYLLSLCTDYGIQYRDGREVVFAWFLRSRRSCQEAEAFYASLPPLPALNQAYSKNASRLTHELQAEFQAVQTVEDLRACYARNLARFGAMHLRAYYYFEQYLNQLIHPTPFWDSEAEEAYSVEAVVDTYLSLHMPSGKKRTDYSLVQKLLKQNWPNATAIKNIRNHKKDVPRKLLLLLYVVTENGLADRNPSWEEDEEDMTLEERVEDHWWTLNAMLGDCGMALLDPRNATDWLILYAVCADPEEPMSERLEQVIDHMFADIHRRAGASPQE